jgi:thiaminase/transcriptional activator TenA
VSASLAADLWAANADLAAAALDHPFVRGLADGRLDRGAFQRYILQDAHFLEAFARAYALALARSPDRAGLNDFYALLGGALDELRRHESNRAGWGIDLPDAPASAATRAYTDFLLTTAALGSVGETCAAMTPCMRLYAALGAALAAAGGLDPSNPYHAWVATYAAPDFAALAATLERLLDRYAAPSDSVRGAYRRAMELEVAFFAASLA